MFFLLVPPVYALWDPWLPLMQSLAQSWPLIPLPGLTDALFLQGCASTALHLLPPFLPSMQPSVGPAQEPAMPLYYLTIE